MPDLSPEDLFALMAPQAPVHKQVTATVVTPTFTSLTEVGSVSKTLAIYEMGGMIFFNLRISTSGGGTSASTAGTTYMALPVANRSNIPIAAANVTTLTGLASGLITASRLYLPTWAATSDEIVLAGIYPRT